MIKWLLCYQTPYDRVKYRTSDIEEVSSMKYYDFIGFLRENFKISDFKNFVDQLDKFQTIFLDCQLGTWEIYEEERQDISTYDRKELLKLNDEEVEKPKDIVGQSKAFVQKYAAYRLRKLPWQK